MSGYQGINPALAAELAKEFTEDKGFTAMSLKSLDSRILQRICSMTGEKQCHGTGLELL